MRHLEQDKINDSASDADKLQHLPQQAPQLTLFASDPRWEKVQEMLQTTDINTLSPVEALLKLNELQLLMKG